jgi:hypothetical protein
MSKAISNADMDQLRLAYKKATDEWVNSIRAEEELATPDHSMVAWERWDAAHFTEQDASAKATPGSRSLQRRSSRRELRNLASA